MATLAQLRDWRDRLVKARATGLKRVEFDGTSQTYRSDAEMASALRDLERQIAEAEGGASARGPIQVHTSKGL